MGEKKSAGGPAPKAEAPSVPDKAPQGLKDFLACTADAYTFKNGPLDWLEMSPAPDLTITPGTTPGTGTLGLKAFGFPISLPAAIIDGKLFIDTSGQDLVPDSALDAVRRFVDGLNGWFRQNGRQLGPPDFGAGGMTLSKVPITGQATQPGTPAEMPYLETKVEQPTIRNQEAFGPYSHLTPPVLDDVGPGSKAASVGSPPGAGGTGATIIGAGGPGGPKAPAGLGRLAAWWVIASAVVIALGLSAWIVLGSSPAVVPVATTLPTARVTIAVTPVTPRETTAAPSAVATVSAGATPNGVANGRFEVLTDQKVDSCHHNYEIGFRVFDSSGNGAVYAGKTATFQILDGHVLTTVVGPDGTWKASVAETFHATAAGCYSRLNPKVITVDGQPTF